MKRYAIFFAATGPDAGRNYLPDTNCLLNSIQKRRIWEHMDGKLTVYLLHYGFPEAWHYPERAAAAFDFNLVSVRLRRSDVPHPADTNAVEFTKRARYFMLRKLVSDFDVVCLMDADMYIVAPEFGGLFSLVSGTDKLLGANERYKWDVGPDNYFYEDGTPIFPKKSRMRAMCCNVPSLFCPGQWLDMLDLYARICFTGYQMKGDVRAGIGDLYAHNIAIHRLGRDTDVVMLPMEAMAQVHHVWRKPWTHLIDDGGHWRSFSGDRVYVIHDTKKMCTDRFLSGNMAKYDEEFAGWKDAAAMRPKIEASLKAVQREWYDLNFNGRLRLTDFIESRPEWDALREV